MEEEETFHVKKLTLQFKDVQSVALINAGWK